MRICFLADGLPGDRPAVINGSQVQVALLARELQRRGHQVVIAASGRRSERAAAWRGVPVFRYAGHERAPVLSSMEVYRLLRHLRADIVYTRGRTFLAGVAALHQWRSAGGGSVWASNNEDGCERWKAVTALWRGPRPLLRKLLRTPADLLADVVCDAGVHCSGACVNQTEYQRTRLLAVHGRRGTVIRSLQIAESPAPTRDQPPLVAWVGRVSPDRRPEAFVELAAALAGVDCRFALVGPADSPAYLERVLAPARGLPTVRYVGPVSLAESWVWIGRAAVLVNTHPREGVSNALVQAWVSGTPTVVMSFDPDGIVQRSGAGFFSGDPETMAQDVRRLVADDGVWRACSERAEDLARREFAPSAVCAAYERVFAEAMPGG